MSWLYKIWVKHKDGFLPLLLEIALTNMHSLLLPSITRTPAQASGLKSRGFICLLLPPHDPGGLILAWPRVLLSGSCWFMGLEERNKGSECVWSVQVKTLRRHFERAPTGIEISLATPVKATLRSTPNPSPGLGSTFHLCTSCSRTLQVLYAAWFTTQEWLTIHYDTKAK